MVPILAALFVVVISVCPLFPAEAWHFTVQPEESEFTVKVGKAGFLKVFGHDHLIDIRQFSGEVDWQAEDAASSSIRIVIDATSLAVIDEGISDADRATIQAEMDSKALDVENYSEILFVSKELSLDKGGGAERMGNLTGQLTLRGVTGTVRVPLTLTVSEQTLRAQGKFKIKASDYGIPQITAAGGTVKTKDELELTFDLVATRN
jgi:polyisoprenoid-binding protein YceI